MGFPAANGATFPLTLDVAWGSARSTAAQIQTFCTQLQATIAAGNVSAQVLINASSVLNTFAVQLASYAAVPGIAAYAQQQVNNPTLDVAGAFTTMQTALTNVLSWIATNFPKDTSNFLQAISFSGLTPAWAIFSTAQLSGLSTQLTALSATIS